MTTEVDIYGILSRNNLFSVLPDTVIKNLSDDNRCVTVEYGTGETVFCSTDFKHALGLIFKGEIMISRVGGGSSVILNTLSYGEVFGAASLFGSGDNFVSTITASEPTSIFFIPYAVVRELITVHSDFAVAYISYLSDKIRFLNHRIAELTASGTQRKLARYLIRHDGEQETSLIQLASELDMGRASLYRELDTLIERGLIKKCGRKIEILDMKGLEDIL